MPVGLSMDRSYAPDRPSRTLLHVVWLALAAAAIHLYFFPKTIHGASGMSILPVEDSPRPGERHLKNLRQLTFGGSNAEAYWSPDGSKLIFQSTRDGNKADQIYIMDA